MANWFVISFWNLLIVSFFQLSISAHCNLVEFIMNCSGIADEVFKDPIEPQDVFSSSPYTQLRYRLKERGWDIIAVESDKFGNGDVVVFNNVPNNSDLARLKKLKCKKILTIWEPPTVCPEVHQKKVHSLFDRIITWNDNLVDGSRYIKYGYPVNHGMVLNLPSFSERKLVCTIIGNKTSSHPNELYSERIRLLNFYEKNSHLSFDLFGFSKSDHPCYVCSPEDKLAVLKNYRFCYAFENYLNNDGYITEKIFDPLMVGSVPIYLGATNIADYIPAGCFIDAREFNTYSKLHSYIESMEEKVWQNYLNNIQKYVNSVQGDRFRTKQLVKAYLKAIFE